MGSTGQIDDDNWLEAENWSVSLDDIKVGDDNDHDDVMDKY